MAKNVEIPEGMFPTLEEGQIARLIPLGQERRVAAGDIVFDQGDTEHGVFVVLEGSIELVNVVKGGEEEVLNVDGVGMFTGEVSHLSGRRTLVRCRARLASRLLEISRANLRHIMQNDAGACISSATR
jgi:thioredoxin reductase (NADPH)